MQNSTATVRVAGPRRTLIQFPVPHKTMSRRRRLAWNVLLTDSKPKWKTHPKSRKNDTLPAVNSICTTNLDSKDDDTTSWEKDESTSIFRNYLLQLFLHETRHQGRTNTKKWTNSILSFHPMFLMKLPTLNRHHKVGRHTSSVEPANNHNRRPFHRFKFISTEQGPRLEGTNSTTKFGYKIYARTKHKNERSADYRQ